MYPYPNHFHIAKNKKKAEGKREYIEEDNKPYLDLFRHCGG